VLLPDSPGPVRRPAFFADAFNLNFPWACEHRHSWIAEEAKRITKEEIQLAILDVRRMFCTAFCQLARALEALGLTASPTLTFGSAELQYQQRFESLRVYEELAFFPYEEVQRRVKLETGEPCCWFLCLQVSQRHQFLLVKY
jgi:hypothetical protein